MMGLRCGASVPIAVLLCLFSLLSHTPGLSSASPSNYKAPSYLSQPTRPPAHTQLSGDTADDDSPNNPATAALTLAPPNGAAHLQGNTFGGQSRPKRRGEPWGALQGAWGKRAGGFKQQLDWPRVRGAWGKKAEWSSLRGAWGKRSGEEPWDTTSKRGKWAGLRGAWGKRSVPFSGGPKRAPGWHGLQGAWGKREAPSDSLKRASWTTMKGAWGKRDGVVDPLKRAASWTTIKGAWGKRSGEESDFYKKKYLDYLIQLEGDNENTEESKEPMDMELTQLSALRNRDAVTPLHLHNLSPDEQPSLEDLASIVAWAIHGQQFEEPIYSGNEQLMLDDLLDEELAQDQSVLVPLADKRAMFSESGGEGFQRLDGTVIVANRSPTWRSLRGAWGKRGEMQDWRQLQGMWGKRGQSNWGSFKGGWGKRNEEDTALEGESDSQQ